LADSGPEHDPPERGLNLLGAGASIAALPATSRAALLDLLLARSDDAIVISWSDRVDARWCPEVVYANPAHARLTGYEAAEVIGRDPGMWAPPDRNAAAHEDLCRCLASLEPARVELAVLTATGDEKWIDSTVTPLDADGDRHYFLEVARDVTERHRLLEELADREGQLREAQELTNVGSWEWDLTEESITWSPEMFRILDVDPIDGELVSFDAYLSHVHPDDHELTRDVIVRAVRTGEGFVFDFRTNRPDGRLQWLQSRGRVERDETGTHSTRMLGTTQDITAQKTSEEALRRQALHDALTGLPNRTLLADRLGHAVAHAARRGSRTAVLFIDIDDFKAVNDNFGHHGGDEALVEVARRLEASLRPSDTLARVGGDEFVAICEDVASPQDATALAARVIDALVAPIRLADGDAPVKVSVGVSVGTSGEQPEALVRRADAAMYDAKLAGGGAYRLFDS
jgi:diguanylate cyclase (GGDEF)-like protein/PAS domain S-box-containing protein